MLFRRPTDVFRRALLVTDPEGTPQLLSMSVDVLRIPDGQPHAATCQRNGRRAPHLIHLCGWHGFTNRNDALQFPETRQLRRLMVLAHGQLSGLTYTTRQLADTIKGKALRGRHLTETHLEVPAHCNYGHTLHTADRMHARPLQGRPSGSQDLQALVPACADHSSPNQLVLSYADVVDAFDIPVILTNDQTWTDMFAQAAHRRHQQYRAEAARWRHRMARLARDQWHVNPYDQMRRKAGQWLAAS